MAQYLADSTGRPVRIDARLGWPGVGDHYYVELDDGRVADQTWLQFFFTPPSDAPEVLFGTREEVVRRAMEYGIADPDILGLWAPRDHVEESLIVLPAVGLATR